MNIYCYRIENNGNLTLLPGDDWLRHSAESEDPIWVHLEGQNPGEFRQALAPLEIDDLLLGMIENRDSFGARIIPWDQALLLVLPELGAKSQTTSTYTAVLTLEGLLITMVESETQGLDEFLTYMNKGIRLHRPTTSALLCAQLLFGNDLRVQRALALRNRVTALMETLDSDPEDVTAGDILDLRSEIRAMDADAEEQMYCIELMGPIESHTFSIRGIEDYYQALLTNARYLDRFTNRLDERVKDLHSQFTLFVQEKTNRKLAVLTMISAIFLPLTLLAGIYGMNFTHMPELGWEFGYPVILLTMAAIAGGSVWIFKRRDWFD